MTKFTAPWLVEGSFQETLQHLITMAEPGAFADVSPEQLTEALIDELRFIGPYDEEEERAAEAYIRQHTSELYHFAQTFFQQTPTGTDAVRREGVVLEINEQGLGVVKDEQSGERFPFTVDKIQKYTDYPKPSWLDARVQFTTTGAVGVTSIEVKAPASASRLPSLQRA